MTQRLTQAFVDAQVANGRDRIVFDTQVSGLGMRVTLAGLRIWVAQARVGGRKRRLTVGYAPDMSLSKARAEALQTLAAMRSGVDPTHERKTRQRAAAARTISVRELADRWMADVVRPKLKPRTILDYEQILAKHILPALGRYTVAEVGREHIERLHLDMKDTPRRANYTIAVVRSLFSFATRRELRAPGNNPAASIKMYREHQRERFLNEAEMAKAAEATAEAERVGKIGPFAAAGLRLCLFTGARSGEITAIKWEHIDWEHRLIRLPDSKTNEPRTIHLSDAAIEVLRKVPHVGPFVISGRWGKSFKTLTRAWIIARAYGGLQDVNSTTFGTVTPASLPVAVSRCS